MREVEVKEVVSGITVMSGGILVVDVGTAEEVDWAEAKSTREA